MQQKWKTFISFSIFYTLAGFIVKLFYDHVIDKPMTVEEITNQTVLVIIGVFFYVLSFQDSE